MASNTLQLTERSRVTSAFSNIREIGFFVDGRNNIPGSKMGRLEAFFKYYRMEMVMDINPSPRIMDNLKIY